MTDRSPALVFAVLLIVGFAWFAATTCGAAPDRPMPSTAPPIGGAAPPRPAAVDEAPADLRESVASPSTPADSATAPADERAFVTVRGRCVRAGATVGEPVVPLAGCTATARVAGTDGSPARAWDEPATDTAAADTGGDGVFVLRVSIAAGIDNVELRVIGPQRCAVFGRFEYPAAGAELDVGDVVLPATIHVTGRIVDTAGAPVVDAGLMFVVIPLGGDAPDVAPSTTRRARSDANGAFVFDEPCFASEWWIGVEDTGPLVDPRSVKIGTDVGDRYELTVVVERPDPTKSITGTVVDRSGQPLDGVGLSANGEGLRGRGRSRADGSFSVRHAGPMPDDGRSGARLSASLRGFEQVEPGRGTRIAWGESDVRVVLKRLASQTIRVVDSAGDAVEDYVLLAFRRAGSGWSRDLGARRLGRSHADGRCTIDALRDGTNAVLVVPLDPGLAPTPLVTFETESLAPQAAAELLVTVEAPIAVAVRVATSVGGAPVHGSDVELIRGFDDERSPSTRSPVVPIRDANDTRTLGFVTLATAVTDASGRARLPAPAGTWTVRVRGADHLPTLLPVTVAPGAAEVVVEVAPAAVVHGTLGPPESVDRLFELAAGGDEPVAVLLTGTETGPGGRTIDEEPAVVAADGTFRTAALEAGEYDASLRYWLKSSPVRAGSVVVPLESSLVVAPGEHREVAFDVARWLPGTVRGRVTVDGEALADVHCFLDRKRSRTRLSLRVETDSDGRYVGHVPPGDYTFSLTLPAQPGPGWIRIALTDEIRVDRDAELEYSPSVTLRRVRVRLVDDDGAPVPNRRVKLVARGFHLPGGLRTDTDGFVAIEPAPLTAFELELPSGDGTKRTLGPIDLPPGVTDGTVTVRTNDAR